MASISQQGVLSQNFNKDTSVDEKEDPPPKPKLDENGLLRLNLNDEDDLLELDDAFSQLDKALKAQKAKLVSKFVNKGKKNKKAASATKNSKKNANKNNNNNKRKKRELLIALKSSLKFISNIGTLRGYKFEDLEKEQNKAIDKLKEVLSLEEKARASRNKAVKIQKQTEKHLAKIKKQKAIVEKELAKAEPALLEARRAVSTISESELTELVSLRKPPAVVANILTVAVWIMYTQVDPLPQLPDHMIEAYNNNKNNSGDATPNSPISPKSPKSPSGGGGRLNLSINGNTHGKAKSSFNFSEAAAKAVQNPRGKDSSKGGGSRSLAATPKHQATRSYGGGGSKARSLSRPTSARKLGSSGGGGNNSHFRQRSSSNALGNDKKKKDVLSLPWQEVRKLIMSMNFKKSVLAFDPKNMVKEVCLKIEKDFLTMEDFTIERANRASKVLGPLVQWIKSLIEYGGVWYKILPMAQEVRRLEIDLEIKKIQVEKLQKKSKEMNARVVQIRSEMLIMIGYKKIGQLYFLLK